MSPNYQPEFPDEPEDDGSGIDNGLPSGSEDHNDSNSGTDVGGLLDFFGGQNPSGEGTSGGNTP